MRNHKLFEPAQSNPGAFKKPIPYHIIPEGNLKAVHGYILENNDISHREYQVEI
jgi:hypothetical protein